MCELIMNFLRGIKKSFDGKDYLRKINQCNTCGKPSFFSSCLSCETSQAYEGWGKKWPGHKDVETQQTLQEMVTIIQYVQIKNVKNAKNN